MYLLTIIINYLVAKCVIYRNRFNDIGNNNCPICPRTKRKKFKQLTYNLCAFIWGRNLAI